MAKVGDSATMHTPHASYPQVVVRVTGKSVYTQHGDLQEDGTVTERTTGHKPYRFIFRNGEYQRVGAPYTYLVLGRGVYIPSMD